ncbi:MAG: hypothetical protein NTW87_02630 [Planctomycetota bacterium]|nr:hypothetical protein [Planctomycetota bacterium]
MNRLIVVALALLLAARAWSADYVWLEGEAPTTKPADAKSAGAGNAQYLSQQKWLDINIEAAKVEKAVPKDGILVGYEFEAPTAGKYEVWNRVGMEFVRAPFDWRIDQGAWQTIQPADLTTDLMELSLWTEVAWIKMGESDLTAGKHVLEIRLLPTVGQFGKLSNVEEKDKKQSFRNILYRSDVLCLYKGSFRPNGRHKPDAEWQADDDKKAAANVFEVRAAADPADRVEVPLNGLWQVCRYDEQEIVDRDGPTKTLPDASKSDWMAIQVPGDKFKVKPELAFCHRFVYRTRLNVPAEMAGRSFFLRFPSINMIASLHVNGQFCGWTKAPYAPWECDATKAVKPGQSNEICLVVKDAYYATTPKKSGKSCRMSFNVPTEWIGSKNWIWQHFDFPVGADYAAHAGILEQPSLFVAGTVYASDVFAAPSVKNKQLGLEITVLNPTAAEKKVQIACEIVPASGGAPEKSIAAKEVTVPAGQEQVLKLAEPWENPKLWWPDEPNLYTIVTRISLDGKVVDVRRTAFGFREWEWNGPQFKLNGVPWQLWADTSFSDGGKDRKSAEEAVAFWRKSGHNMWRFWGRQFGGMNSDEALSFMDSHGVIVRRSGIFDGEGANYLHGLANNTELFDNWIVQLKAAVKAERNHPSVLIWSVENEITFINSRNLGLIKSVEPEIARAAREVMALDPTRPVMVDGGNCLVDRSLPVNGVHYQESFWRDYPDEAYTLEKAYSAHEKPVLGWGKVPWQLLPDRPIFMGESYYLRGSNPSAYSQFGGEGCFGGRGAATRLGGGLLAKMLAEGYRWHGVAAHHFWLGSEDADLHYNSWKPVCVFCRQWNWTFAGGSEVKRTLKVFNDTHAGDPIEMAWELKLDGRSVAAKKETCNLAPGAHQETEIAVSVPAITRRTAGEFVLTCSRGGKEVFREVKLVAAIDPNGPKPAAGKEDLVVLDPFGSVKARLQSRGIAFTEAAKVADISGKAKVVVIGKDALSPREATDTKWLALAARGTRLLVLDQQNPLHYMAVPADLVPTVHAGRIAFSENLEHPIFDGLAQQDFFTWSKDHIVYRNVYRKATRGAMSLAHCDEELGCSAVSQCPVNDGLLLLCQLVVGEKLAFDPVAQRLFDNMLAYCASYAPVRKSTAVVMDPNTPAGKLLAESGLKCDAVDNLLPAISGGKHQIVVFDANPANLKALAGAADAVKAFTDGGGWLRAWNRTPEGLADFNKAVGVEHVIRPFELERVIPAAVRDPLLSGLTGRDVAMESGEQIFPWSGDKYLVHDEFAYVVDLDDIAPFCEFPAAKAGDHAAARKAAAGWQRNMVNGFTSADAWKLIYYMQYANPRITLKLPRQEEITNFAIVPNTHYAKPTKVNLYFDDDPKPLSLVTKPLNERQEFPIEPHPAGKLTIELAEFDAPGVTTGIDNVWIKVKRSDQWPALVKPLLNIGALVKYPMGKGGGGLLLCQLNILPRESVPENAQKKKNIATTLLRNLGAVFAGSKILVPGEGLKYEPVALEERCNGFLTRDRGWFAGSRDLKHLPIGQVTFAGVQYLIRDFRTSPLPSCVMLSGPGAKGNLALEVKDLRVGKTAELLFFLHTLNRAKEWRPGKPEDQPPVVFKYVVHYADGQTADVPVRYGEGVDHWIGAQPKGLQSASVAWAAPFPDEKSDDQAVLYQFQWANPRPQVQIQSIDMLYGPQGSQFGTPVLLAVTAATEAK